MSTTPDPSPLLGEPEDDRFVREDFEWADIVVDGRVADGDLRTPLPENLTGAPPRHIRDYVERVGRDAEEMWGRLGCATTMSAAADFPSASGTYTAEGYVVTGVSTKPLVAVRIVCPDGFRLGIVTGPYGEDFDPTESVWDRYSHYSMDGLGRVLSMAYTPAQAGLSLERAVGSLRDALTDPDRWITPQVGSVVSGDNDGWRFVRHSLCGGAPGTPGGLLLDNLQTSETVPDSRAAGWWLGHADDAAWVAAVDAGDWLWAHFSHPEPHHPKNPHSGADWSVRAWGSLLAMKQAGWSLAAMRILHTPETVQTIYQTRREAQPLLWDDAVHSDRWVAAAGSPEAASLCIEARLGLAEVEQMVADGAGPDLDAVRTLRALLHTNDANDI